MHEKVLELKLKSKALCYELMQAFTVTGLFAGQHNTELHDTITGV